MGSCFAWWLAADQFRPGTTAVIPLIWQLPQQVWRCRLRPKGGHQLLDLILGSPRSAVQDLGRVRFVEHVAQLDEGGEVQSAVGEVFGDDGKTRQQPRGRGATKSRRLGEPETIGAERKQRREPERKDGPAPIELGQEAEQLDEQAAFVRADFEEPRGERVVWKVCQDRSSSSCCTLRFSKPPKRARMHLERFCEGAPCPPVPPPRSPSDVGVLRSDG